MDSILKAFANNAYGIINLVWILLFLAFLCHYLLWQFGWGRYKKSSEPKIEGSNLPAGAIRKKKEPLRYLTAQALVKIINDFRHLLALVIVSVFAIALGFALYQAGNEFKDIKEAFQIVTATLGGLVGSIIGYYFGESAALSAGSDEVVTTVTDGENEQDEFATGEDSPDPAINVTENQNQPTNENNQTNANDEETDENEDQTENNDQNENN